MHHKLQKNTHRRNHIQTPLAPLHLGVLLAVRRAKNATTWSARIILVIWCAIHHLRGCRRFIDVDRWRFVVVLRWLADALLGHAEGRLRLAAAYTIDARWPKHRHRVNFVRTVSRGAVQLHAADTVVSEVIDAWAAAARANRAVAHPLLCATFNVFNLERAHEGARPEAASVAARDRAHRQAETKRCVLSDAGFAIFVDRDRELRRDAETGAPRQEAHEAIGAAAAPPDPTLPVLAAADRVHLISHSIVIGVSAFPFDRS